MITKHTTIALVMLTTTVLASDGVRADEAWLCSVASAIATDEDGTVGPPDLGDRERPTFFRVDTGKKELKLLAPESRRGEVTKLETVREADGVHILSGIENGRLVSLVIADDGRMTLSIIGDGVVWSVFGHALPESKSN